MGGVYGLSSSRNRRIRYIGKADNLARREYQHRYNESLPQLAEWIRRERYYGFELVFDVLEYCEPDVAHYRESHWLERLPDLFNERKYRGLGYRLPLNMNEKNLLNQISGSQLGYVENWQGYVGLRYYLRSETWRVHVQTGGPHYWLMGDGGSCLQIGEYYSWKFGHSYAVGDHHFIRWEGALEARDKFRTEYERGASPLWRACLSWAKDDPTLHRNHTGLRDYDLDLECLVPEAFSPLA